MITENEVQPDGVVGDSPQQVLQAARNIIEADTADMEECGQNGGCGKDHADEVAHGEARHKEDRPRDQRPGPRGAGRPDRGAALR